jgi:glycosyltransferase involved in cell wall biosynthesis
MIKVLQVIGSLRIGGAETVAMNLYRYIDREKFEFHYLVYGDSVGDYEGEVESLGGKVIHMKPSRNLLTYTKALESVLYNYGPYDVIHSHLMFHNGIVLNVAKKNNIAIRVSHAHSTKDGVQAKGALKRLLRTTYVRIMRNYILKNANVFIACGYEAGCYLYGKEFYEKKGVLIKNGIDLDKYIYKPDIRKSIQCKYSLEGKRIYACIGHFEVEKNHKFLIEVFKDIIKVDSKAYLVLLGEGTLKEEIYKLCVNSGINNNVLFTGNVDNVNEWLQAIDFILMPSLFEGFPVTLVEAQAAGVKCFVADNISQETNITGQVQFLPLEKREEWIKIASLPENYRRPDNREALKKGGFSVKESMKKIEQIYTHTNGNKKTDRW